MTISWLADKIEQWPTDKLVPYARNARTHSDSQVAQIAASIAEFGFTNPNSAIEAAICATCESECVRALRA